MTYFLAKALFSGFLVAAISEIARRSPGFGALVASLPLVSILAMIWLWRDTSDLPRIADHAQATFWLVLPTMPMFLLIPWMLRSGWGFWPALGAGIAVTIALYSAILWLAPRLGIVL